MVLSGNLDIHHVHDNIYNILAFGTQIGSGPLRPKARITHHVPSHLTSHCIITHHASITTMACLSMVNFSSFISAMLFLVSIRTATSLMTRKSQHFFGTRHGLTIGTSRSSFLSTSREENGNWYEPSLMDHMLYRIKECNHIPSHIKRNLVDFSVGGKILGQVTPKVANLLCSISASSGPIFELSQNSAKTNFLTLTTAAGVSPESRTAAVASVMEQLRDSGYISGWRNEMYPVAESFNEVSTPMFLIERAAAPILGVLEYGVHINGLVLEGGERKMWMARRSTSKSKFPGYLDHIVAGGQPAGLSLTENVIKECFEEAGIPPDMTMKRVKPAGAISYAHYGGKLKDQDEGVINRVVLFNFDLELPSDFLPQANDGEVESFFKWTLKDIAQSMNPECDDPIKPNCYLVIIDWLLRTGAISPDSPKYLDVLRLLRSGTCQ